MVPTLTSIREPTPIAAEMMRRARITFAVIENTSLNCAIGMQLPPRILADGIAVSSTKVPFHGGQFAA
jgi:hypothetical protein